MTDKINRRIPPSVQPPVFLFDEQRASEAYTAHIALLDQERRHPSLKDNPVWQMVRADAYEAFCNAFGGQG